MIPNATFHDGPKCAKSQSPNLISTLSQIMVQDTIFSVSEFVECIITVSNPSNIVMYENHVLNKMDKGEINASSGQVP